MKHLKIYITEKYKVNSKNIEKNRNILDLDDFNTSDKKIPKEISDLEESLFEWVDSKFPDWESEEEIMDYLSDDEGLVEWADQENVDHDIIGSMIHDFKPDIITYWVHKWFVENHE